MQVRDRHRIRVIRAPLTVETLAWRRADRRRNLQVAIASAKRRGCICRRRSRPDLAGAASASHRVSLRLMALGLDLLEIRQLTPDRKSPELGDSCSP
jgi:hypothetical protein